MTTTTDKALITHTYSRYIGVPMSVYAVMSHDGFDGYDELLLKEAIDRTDAYLRDLYVEKMEEAASWYLPYPPKVKTLGNSGALLSMEAPESLFFGDIGWIAADLWEGFKSIGGQIANALEKEGFFLPILRTIARDVADERDVHVEAMR